MGIRELSRNGWCRRWGRDVVLAVVARGRFVVEGGGRGARGLLESEVSRGVLLEPLHFSFLGFSHSVTNWIPKGSSE